VVASSNSATTWPPLSTRPRPVRLSTPARKRFATSWPTSERPPIRPPFSSAPRPRKRLFPPPLHPQTGRPLHNKGPDEHTILTVNGRITLRRRRYADPAVGSCYPLDAWLDRAEDSISLGLRELACRLNLASRNFDKAAENLGRAAQVHLSGEFLRQVVESEGKAVVAAAKAGQLPIDWQASDCPAWDKEGQKTERSRIYLGSDGVMVPHITDQEKRTRRERVKARRRRCGKKRRALPKAKPGADGPFKEFKIVTLYDDAAEHRLVSVTRGDCEQAGRLMRRDAGRVGLDKADDKVGVVDGSEWIKNQIQRQSLPLDDLGLDFYHLSENVHKARRAVYGEEDPKDEKAAGNVWAGQLLHLAKHEGYEKLRDAIVQWKGGLRGASQRQAGELLLNYVTDRREMIQYPKFQELGRQIGSGPTESMCKAATQRIKGRGMRWDGDNAENIMALEALEQSGAWQAYWEMQLCIAA
jgi:uncharacterized protein UPF0236